MDATAKWARGVWAGLIALASIAGVAAAQNSDASITLVTPGAAPQAVFQYQFAAGQYAHFEVDQNHVVQTQFDQGNERVVNQMLAQKNYRVVSVETDGTAVLEPMVSKVRMSAKFNETEPIVYDSTEGGAALPQFQSIQATVGRPVARMTFASNGQLLKITPLQGAPDQIAKMAAKTDPTANFLVVFPKEPIGAGAVWRDKFTVQVTAGEGIAPPVKMQREYQITKLNGSVATISLKTSILTPLQNPKAEAQLLTRQLSGTIEFDTARGLILSHTTKAEGNVVEAFGPKTMYYSKMETKERLVPAAGGVQPATLKEIGATN
ncbi:MAG TPA: hypothetical protein VFG20_02945 [Planctomycetaceae bacterium]|nr:hypothetical protein [Planctomycetaceae bacterium]